ncbi:MAG: hypothetical protein IPJ98_26390 [Bryobacterales bacterium]|nr:hypothetical protein [Bryobacterales bacterium]
MSAAMQQTSLPGTRFWDEKAKAAKTERAADRHQVFIHFALVLALIVFAIAVSTLLARLGG